VFIVSCRIPDNGQSPKNPVILSVIHHRQNSSESACSQTIWRTSHFWETECVSSLVIKHVKTVADLSLLIRHCWTRQENPCAKSLKVTDVAGVVSKLINVIRQKWMNRRQFKDFFRDMENEYWDDLYVDGWVMVGYINGCMDWRLKFA
jgi:hypothetical protein